MQKLTILERKRISSGFLNVDKVTIELPSGATIRREVLQKKDVIAIVAVTPEGEIFLTKQPRAGVNNLESIEIPAGLVESGEDPQTAAKRELLEETGCVSDNWEFLGFFTADPACCTSITRLFMAKDVKVVAEQKLDASEYLVKFKATKNDVAKMLASGEICDANSIIALQKAKLF